MDRQGEIWSRITDLVRRFVPTNVMSPLSWQVLGFDDDGEAALEVEGWHYEIELSDSGSAQIEIAGGRACLLSHFMSI